jgi:hypothetical protein
MGRIGARLRFVGWLGPARDDRLVDKAVPKGSAIVAGVSPLRAVQAASRDRLEPAEGPRLPTYDKSGKKRCMFKRIKGFGYRSAATILKAEERLDHLKMLQGKVLSEINASKRSTNLIDYEFKVFSQWGEDGILQKLINAVEIRDRTFIEFGVEDFFESNCRFLLMNNNWSGFVVDGSQQNIDRLRNSYFYWRYQIDSVAEFVTRDNVDAVLSLSKFDRDIGVLSIDIDGVDYFVFEAITAFRPRILILEYNAVFGKTRKITVPYSERFHRTAAHYSNLYFGASLPALHELAAKKGYALVGTTSSGVNAFFVREDLLNDALAAQTAESAYNPSKTRESRDKRGFLSFVQGDDRLGLIKGMPVYNIESNQMEPL